MPENLHAPRRPQPKSVRLLRQPPTRQIGPHRLPLHLPARPPQPPRDLLDKNLPRRHPPPQPLALVRRSARMKQIPAMHPVHRQRFLHSQHRPLKYRQRRQVRVRLDLQSLRHRQQPLHRTAPERQRRRRINPIRNQVPLPLRQIPRNHRVHLLRHPPRTLLPLRIPVVNHPHLRMLREQPRNPPHFPRPPVIVRVQQKNQLPARLRYPPIKRRRLPPILLVNVFHSLRILPHPLPRVVRRPIVHHQDLHLLRRKILPHHASDGFFDVPPIVVRINQNADSRCAHGFFPRLSYALLCAARERHPAAVRSGRVIPSAQNHARSHTSCRSARPACLPYRFAPDQCRPQFARTRPSTNFSRASAIVRKCLHPPANR